MSILVESIRDAIKAFSYMPKYITINVNRACYVDELTEMGLVVTLDDKIESGRFYLSWTDYNVLKTHGSNVWTCMMTIA